MAYFISRLRNIWNLDFHVSLQELHHSTVQCKQYCCVTSYVPRFFVVQLTSASFQCPIQFDWRLSDIASLWCCLNYERIWIFFLLFRFWFVIRLSRWKSVRVRVTLFVFIGLHEKRSGACSKYLLWFFPCEILWPTVSLIKNKNAALYMKNSE